MFPVSKLALWLFPAFAFAWVCYGARTFEKDVVPILEKHCVRCHGPEKQKGGLRLDQKQSVFAGGDSKKPAVVPHSVEKSRLIELVSATADSDLRMPPKGEMLNEKELAVLRDWIAQGADWPESSATGSNGPREMVVTDADRQHWAFRPLNKAADISEQLRNQSTQTAASRHKLIRRAYFGLLGLPPSPKEIEAFENAPAADAYERLIDRLLHSKHYGERWGRHWLDLARYADSDGYEADKDRPQAWPYRDWVIRAFNDDMPYDQFVKWQLAGDEYAPSNPDAVSATGFLTAGPIADTTPADTEENKLTPVMWTTSR